jgi:hypothetical protein
LRFNHDIDISGSAHDSVDIENVIAGEEQSLGSAGRYRINARQDLHGITDEKVS